MATAIIETFDNELELVYYIPGVKKKPAKGKLWDAYNNYRTKLAKVELISRRSRGKKLPPTSCIKSCG